MKVVHPREEASLTTITNSKGERIPKTKVNQDMFDQYVRTIYSISKNRCELAG
jgi:hypothetical protein